MKKGQVFEGIVENVVYPNKGIVYAEGCKVAVKNCIQGQKIRFSVKKARKDRCEGRLLEVLERSPLEMAEAACAHFSECGGCAYQTLGYDAQLQLKRRQVEDLIQTVYSDCKMEGILGSPAQFAYRNKMEFSFGDSVKDGPLALGLHKRNNFYDIVTVDQCRIVDGDFCKILACVLQCFQERRIPYFHKVRHTGYLRHLLVRKAARTGEILVCLVTTGEAGGTCPDSHSPDTHSPAATEDAGDTCLDPHSPGTHSPAATEDAGDTCLDPRSAASRSLSATKDVNDTPRYAEAVNHMASALLELELTGQIAGILHMKNDSLADVVKSDETVVLYGRDYFYEEILGLRFQISPFSFFQTNTLGAEVLYQKVREYISVSEGQVVFDLYSGTGTIAQIVAATARKVVGVEIVGEAVDAARENARQNMLDNCVFLQGDVLKVLEELEDRPDSIILDPPRDGMHPKALQRIIDFGVERIVYVSCKPTSLARDLAAFQAAGYRLEKCCCVDLFPGTVHVETVCLLSKPNGEHHIEVEVKMDEMDLTAAESKATYEEIKKYVLIEGQ